MPKRPERLAWTLEETITGQRLPAAFSVSSKREARPKFPSMNSFGSFGRLTPARWNTKSQSLQKRCRSSGLFSRPYSQISSMTRPGLVRFFPSRMAFKFSTRFLPTKPRAPVTRIFISLLRIVQLLPHIVRGQKLFDHALHVQQRGVVTGVALLGLGQHLALDKVLIVV